MLKMDKDFFVSLARPIPRMSWDIRDRGRVPGDWTSRGHFLSVSVLNNKKLLFKQDI